MTDTRKRKASLASMHRKLSREWHPTRNGELTPRDVAPSSKQLVWWLCAVDREHEWQTLVLSRAKSGSGCPFCAGIRVTAESSLAARFPEVAEQWHITKNGRLRPTDVAPHSGKKVWWKCPKNRRHSWQAAIGKRTVGKGCPFCAGKRASTTNCLARKQPKLAREWHPSKNNTLTPRDVTPGSSKSAWWTCDNGHEWKAVIYKRAGGHGCPFCSGQRVSSTNSLQARHPRLAREWHPTRNRSLSPCDVTAGTDRKIWWQCAAAPDHEWRAQVYSRTRLKTNCPFCAGHRPSATHNLAAKHPHLAEQWHPTKNGSVGPTDVTPKSGRKVWWRCPTRPSHTWTATIASRANGNGCPICAGQLVTKMTSLQARFPKIAQQWHPRKNGEITPNAVAPNSSKLVWWRCLRRRCRHEWQSTVSNRKKGSGCPQCAGSIAPSLHDWAPDVAREWHPTKNGELTPRDVSRSSHSYAWWQCRRNGRHVWRAEIIKRGWIGRGCPMCANHIATAETSLRTLFPRLAREWHQAKNGELTPDDVVPGSNKRAWWRCEFNRHHEWETTVCQRAKEGTDCPHCYRASIKRKGRRKKPKVKVPILI